MVLTVAIVSFPDAVLAHPKPLIGAQISVLEGDNWKTCENYFYALKELGYNTIILRVFHNHGDRFHNPVKESARKQRVEGVYFNTDYGLPGENKKRVGTALRRTLANHA